MALEDDLALSVGIKKGDLVLPRRAESQYFRDNIVVLGYGELACEYDKETFRAIRWKLGDGRTAWDDLPDIPGPEYALGTWAEASVTPR